MIVWKYSLNSHDIAHKTKPYWKSIAVTRWNHRELAPGWNFAPFFKTGKITPGWNFTSDRMCNYFQKFPHRHGLFQRDVNFTPGRNLTCDGSLIKVIKANRRKAEHPFVGKVFNYDFTKFEKATSHENPGHKTHSNVAFRKKNSRKTAKISSQKQLWTGSPRLRNWYLNFTYFVKWNSCFSIS